VAIYGKKIISTSSFASVRFLRCARDFTFASFYQVASVPTKSKTEKASDKTEVAIHAPSDLAAQGQAVELNHTQPAGS